MNQLVVEHRAFLKRLILFLVVELFIIINSTKCSWQSLACTKNNEITNKGNTFFGGHFLLRIL